MTAVMKWRRAKLAKPTESARLHVVFPRDSLGTAARAEWRRWRLTLTPADRRTLARPPRR
ncbi:hypothetical protein ABMB68_001605 [Bradyrhizobium sp. RT4a]